MSAFVDKWCSGGASRLNGTRCSPISKQLCRVLLWLLIAVTSSFAGPPDTGNAPDTLGISVVSSTSLHKTLPYDLFSGNVWHAKPGTRYVRLDLYLDHPRMIGGVEVELVNPVTRPITLYLNDLDIVRTIVPESNKIVFRSNSILRISSIKLNFQENSSVAIKKITILDRREKPYILTTSRIVSGEAVASSTLEPERYYNAMMLFDSKFENGWNSNRRQSGDTLSFAFREPQVITAIKLWNGYQRSEVHYRTNSRIKTLQLEDGAGYSQTITVENTTEPQTIVLPEKFAGKHLRMIVSESYPGEKYKDLALSELRFFDGKEYFMIDPLQVMKSAVQYNDNQFSNGKIGELLDKEARNRVRTNAGLVFRFRSDGSFYLEGAVTAAETSNRYFALGNFEIKKATADSTNLRLFGYMVTENGTARYESGDCGGYVSYVYKGSVKSMFVEYLTIFPMEKPGQFTFVNSGKRKNINFDGDVFYVDYFKSQGE